MKLRKTTSTPLNLKSLSKTHQSSLTLKGGSTAFPKPLSPQGTGDVQTALLGAQTASLYGWRTIRGLRQQRSCGFLCGINRKDIRCWMLARCWWNRKDIRIDAWCWLLATCWGGLLMETQGPMLDAVMKILFIRLWTGSTLERFPSGLWRKSCDHHWHLMNDHNDRDYHL